MKVTLAYEYEDHQPDETIDLPDREALRLISDGRARRASKFVKAEKVDPDKPKEQ